MESETDTVEMRLRGPVHRLTLKLCYLLIGIIGLVMTFMVFRPGSKMEDEVIRSSLHLPRSPEDITQSREDLPRSQEDLIRSQQEPSRRRVVGQRSQSIPCSPIRNIYFLKVHKCASTTVASILVRYAQKWDLIFGQTRHIGPLNSSGRLGWPDRFRPDHVVGTLVRGNNGIRKYHYEAYLEGQNLNIVALHTIYDRATVKRVMPDNTVSVAIIRRPFEQFQSMLDSPEFGILKHNNLTDQEPIATFLENPDKYDFPHHGKKLIRNFIITEFGYENEAEENEMRIRSYLEYLNKQFLLVMVAEHFVESVILLRRYLCWTTQDVIYLRLMVNRRKDHYVTSSELVRYLYLEAMHKTWSLADHLLYDYFNKTLWKNIEQEGNDFYDEVEYFRMVADEIQLFCDRPTDDTIVHFKATKWGPSFSVNVTTCSELNVNFHAGIYEAFDDILSEDGELLRPQGGIGLLLIPVVLTGLFLFAVILGYLSKMCWPQRKVSKKKRYSP